MDRDQFFQLIYAGIAIFGTYLLAARLLTGDWLAALWPLALVAFCGYRLVALQQ